MAAAYAALLSLSQILHQILNPPPSHHFIFPRERVVSLRDKVILLIDFLETHPTRRSHEIEDLEERIVAAVYEAEDLIESKVVRMIQVKYAMRQKLKSFAHFCRSVKLGKGELLPIPIQKVLMKRALLKVIENFTSIVGELDEIKNRKGVEDSIRGKSSKSSSSTSLPGGRSIMVGFEEHLDQIRSILALDDSNLLIVPIVGMGGIGKTTLASNVFSDPYLSERFDIRSWVSVSQEYKVREIVMCLLQQTNCKIDGDELSTDELGVLLYKELFGRKYLIVLDDVWDIQSWEKLRRFVPDTGDGSRILVTTRLVNLAMDFGSCSPYQMSLLDERNSWNLVYEYLKEDCPVELEEIGRSIARGCGGLPLALVVIGGLLAKSEKTRDFWEYVEQNVSSTANYADHKKCMEILRLSYIELPVHLKPCFLYLAMFPKTFEIRVSRLIRLWVAEGFIRPTEDACLEEVAEGYLKYLLDRNLVMMGKLGHSGKVKSCIIHDLIRDLCMDESHKNKFLCIAHLDDPNSSRRLSVHSSTSNEKKVNETLRLAKHSRSLFSYSAWESRRQVALKLNLLRVLDVMDSYSMDDIMWLINSRYITCAIPRELHVSSFMSMLWSLQTLVFPWPISLPPEFWQMPQLRHLKIPGITLSNPLEAEGGGENIVVLKNLQTLTTVREFIFSENALRRIPNLKKLGIDCNAAEGIGSFCLNNLPLYLHKLESFDLKSRGTYEKMAFPISLRKLTLSNCQIPWEDMSGVGALPKLEVLKLQKRAAQGYVWSPNEGEFLRLKMLLIDWCQLENWEADDSHFPSLEHLQLVGVRMKEFPLDFAQIATLRKIDLNYCSRALFVSAKTISVEREDFGLDDIQIRCFPSEASVSKEKKVVVVGFEDESEKLKGYLFENSQELDVICIVGMPGIGKTTMARKIFHDPEIQYEFPISIWITVSREFSAKNVFVSILREFTGLTEEVYHRDESDGELANLVSNYLGLVKFLLVLDDVWSIDDIGRIQSALPRNNNKGKVLITSRAMEVCLYANRHRVPHSLRFLTNEESWLLLWLELFGNPEFPSELEVEGREIAEQCMGLPLAVVLIGGFVVRKLLDDKTSMKNASKEVSERFNSAFLGNERKLSMTIASLSYEILPYPLKKCFLYVGMFPEDYKIPTWKLIRLWIAEGFIQQEDDISVEETAEKYLNDLIMSNLLRAEKLNGDGKVKTCVIHDELREFCIEKAGIVQENIFKHITKFNHRHFQSDADELLQYQRLCIHSDVLDFLTGKPKCSSVISLVCFSKEDFLAEQKSISAIPSGFKQLQVLDIMPFKITLLPSNIYHLLHIRYMALSFLSDVLPAAFSKFRNIQTLVVHTTSPTLDIKADMLNMIELRHFKTNASATLPKPDASSEGGGNIQTLGMISPESCTEELFDRTPNLKKLGIRGRLALLLEDNNRSFNSLGKLENLEKLKLVNDAYFSLALHGLPPSDKFPIKLRSLTLCKTSMDWSYTSILGSLENLEVLKLKDHAFRGMVWEVSDGGFPHLEILHIRRANFEVWVASHHHFPRLRSLELHVCENLQQVPLGLADVPSFQRLDLDHCSNAAASAQKIFNLKRKKDDQQSGNVRPFSLSISPA